MFKIESLTFCHNNDSQTYYFSSHSFVYGANTVGKTAMTKAINYVLGSSEPLSYQGLDNIDSIEALLSNENTKLWIKRTIDGFYYYKRTKESSYSSVSSDTYKNNICLVLNSNIDNHYIEVYRKVFDETPSFRSFNFLNYVEEKGLGDLSTVFTMGKELKHQIRIQRIMNFFFNFNNIEIIYDKEIELEKIEKQLSSLKSQYQSYTHTVSQQKKLFSELQLKYTGDFQKDYDTFIEFQKTFVRKKKDNLKDIVYLSKVSFSLAEEIKLYSFMKSQTNNMIDRKERIKRLLSILNSIVLNNPEYTEYVDCIKKTICEIDNEKIILSLTDYQKTIKAVEAEKSKIDTQINQLKGEATELTYEDAVKKVGLLENVFSVLSDVVNIAEIEGLEKKVSTLKKEIKDLHNLFDKKTINKFNEKLTDFYLDKDLEIKHVVEDRNEKDFSLEFDPFRLFLFSKHREDNVITQYIPGSMARQTHLQLLVYLNMFAYLKENFNGFVYMPLLIIDSANQPMGVESFNKVYPILIEFAEKIGIQTIFLSKDKIENVNPNDIIDISSGLNKFHK